MCKQSRLQLVQRIQPSAALAQAHPLIPFAPFFKSSVHKAPHVVQISFDKVTVVVLPSSQLDTEKDLTTSDITSNFKHYLLKSKEVVKTKLYTLKVTEAATASQVFIKLEEIEVSNTSIERVEHSDLDNLKNRMRTKAIVNAKERVVSLTNPLNQTVGPAIHIVDTDNFISQQVHGRAPGIQIRGMSSFVNNFSELPKIEFEKIKVTASITAKFILK